MVGGRREGGGGEGGQCAKSSRSIGVRGPCPSPEAYLIAVDVDSLLWAWRQLARLPTLGAQPLTGWEHPSSELRGHFLGHWLSAAAVTVSMTASEELAARLEYVVAALRECQDKLNLGGYVSAFPPTLLDRFEAQKPVWAPLYTLHKVLAGLLDAYEMAGSRTGLVVATRLAEYLGARVDAVVAERGLEAHFQALHMEYGGVNDVFWRLVEITGEGRWARYASMYDKPCFLNAAPTAESETPVDGLHANTHLPIAVGAARRAAVTGESFFRVFARRLHRTLLRRAFPTGGASYAEVWRHPHQLTSSFTRGSPAGVEHQETCTTFNHLKLADQLFRWHAAPSVADFMERALANGVLGTERGASGGEFLYFLPLGTNVSKAAPQAWRPSGYSIPHGDFWCGRARPAGRWARGG